MARQSAKTAPRERVNPEKEFINLKFSPMSAKNEMQKKYFNALNNFKIVFGIGPAGTGKSACAVSHACAALYQGNIEKIVITRPLIAACEEEIGFLPGTVDEKAAPYLAGVRAIMDKVLGKSTVEMFLKDGKIEAIPLAFCRGRTFDNAHIIVDEAQNLTPSQALMILTRIGYDSKIFLNGDAEQSDRPDGESGLDDAIKRISWMPDCKVIEFGLDDIVRSYLISDIIQSYRRTA